MRTIILKILWETLKILHVTGTSYRHMIFDIIGTISNGFQAIIEYCEEETWAWGFPNHKCQKSCQITGRRRVICKEFFGMSDLENPILTYPISQYSRCRKLQICINWEKTREIAAKCWVKLMYTLCDDLTIFLKLRHCKVWTWLFVPQFRYYSSFLQCFIFQ